MNNITAIFVKQGSSICLFECLFAVCQFVPLAKVLNEK